MHLNFSFNKFTRSVTITAVIFPLVQLSQANEIDWTGSVIDSNTRPDRSYVNNSNLPGVKTNPTSSARQNFDCESLSNAGAEIGNPQFAGSDCNKKKPLIVIREDRLEGILFNFPK